MDNYSDYLEAAESYYARIILEQWYDIHALSVEFRMGLMIKDHQGKVEGCDEEIAREYLVRMTKLWLDLLPEVENKSEFDVKWFVGDDVPAGIKNILSEDFFSFRKYSQDPTIFFCEDEETDWAKMFILEEILRRVLDKLSITRLKR